MKKDLRIKIATCLILVLIYLAMACIIFESSAASKAGTAAPNPNSFTGASASTSGITNIGNQLITIISTVGSIASVIVLVVLGLKYMMGSAEEKAEYKKTLMPYVIGAGLVFAASAISGIIYSFTNGLGG